MSEHKNDGAGQLSQTVPSQIYIWSRYYSNVNGSAAVFSFILKLSVCHQVPKVKLSFLTIHLVCAEIHLHTKTKKQLECDINQHKTYTS